MLYPSMGSNKRNTVSIPALSGGVNFNDALNLVDDNQLTDCKNVWYKDGILQTRPGYNVLNREVSDKTTAAMFESNDVLYYQSKKVKIYGVFDGSQISFKFVDCDVAGEKLTVLTANLKVSHNPNAILYYNDDPKLTDGKGIFAMISFYNGVILYELVGNTFVQITDIYVPTVYLNGKGALYNTLPVNIQGVQTSSTFLEGYNMLCNGVTGKYYYTSDGKSNEFILPVSFANSKITVKCINPDNGKSMTFGPLNIGTTDIDIGSAQVKTDNNTYLMATNLGFNSISFWKKNKEYDEGDTNDPEYIGFVFENALGKLTNNICVTVESLTKNKNNLTGVRFGTWFGGESEGVYGGTRLFVSGNPSKPNMLFWSDLKNPTYFSENNYLCVGDKAQKITALKRYEDMLLVFKEHEIYYIKYSTAATYDANDIISGKIIDAATANAIFPAVQISSEIGCDMPETIQLCGNRMIWMCKDGNIYMLKTTSQYNKVNVSKISAMIERTLKQHYNNLTDVQKTLVTSAVYDGHYFLKIHNKIYVLNYDDYYFSNLPAYASNKKAQRQLKWYIWDFPDTGAAFFSFAVGNKIFLFISNNLGTQRSFEKMNIDMNSPSTGIDVYYNFKGEKEESEVESVVQTKMFDFGAMDIFKSIEQMYIGFGKSPSEICIEYLTEKGTVAEKSLEINDEVQFFSPQYIKTKRFLPGIKRALRFGLRVNAKGRIAVDGILIKYKYMGVTR